MDGTPSQLWSNVQDNQKSLLQKLSHQAGFQYLFDLKLLVGRFQVPSGSYEFILKTNNS